jgi:hypothetical protein
MQSIGRAFFAAAAAAPCKSNSLRATRVKVSFLPAVFCHILMQRIYHKPIQISKLLIASNREII